MFPLLDVGDEVLLDIRAYQQQRPKIGDIVAAYHPSRAGTKIVKRVTAVHPANTYQLRGDNPKESTDFDNISIDQIIGRVTSRFG